MGSLLYKPLSIGLAVALLLSLIFGGWNWWRKGVYYDALNNVAASKAAAASKAEKDLAAKRDTQTLDLLNRSIARELTLQRQLDEIALNPPAERVVYKLRDRWLPVSCPAGASGAAESAEVGGLQREDELSLVRLSNAADAAIDERNSCISLYQAARDSLIKFNK